MNVQFVDSDAPIQKAKWIQKTFRNVVVICDAEHQHEFDPVLVADVRLELKKEPATVVLVTNNPRALTLVWWPLISRTKRNIWINAPQDARDGHRDG